MNELEDTGMPAPDKGSPAPHHRAQKIALFFLKYVLGISLIVWMVLSGKLDLSVLGSLPPALLLQCLALMVLQSILAALRVRYILAHQDIETNLWQCLLFNCSGVLYSAFLPGGISGDAVRAYLFMKAIPNHRLPILGAMFLDRVLGLLSMVTLGLCAAIYMAIKLPVIRPYLLAFSAIFLALVGGIAVLHFIGRRHKHHDVPLGRLPNLWSKLKRIIAELRIHHYQVPVLLAVVLQSVLIHLTAVAVIFLCSVNSGAGLGFLEVFVATPIGLLVNAIPLSPGGLGIGENAFELLYRAIGGKHGATSFLMARVFLYSPALIGLVYVLKRMVTRKR
jgi:glycosyltransferase 2 family protein